MRDDAAISTTAQDRFPGELLIWLSPAFPVGGFAYSHGLESAVDRDWITNAETLHDWISNLIHHGSLTNDLILMSLVFNAPGSDDLHELAELSNALQPSAERARETQVQGQNFLAAYRAGWADLASDQTLLAEYNDVTLPFAVAAAARSYGISSAATLEAYAIALCSNLHSAAIRLSVIGQFDAQRLMARHLGAIRDVCAKAATATIDDLGSATFGADLASMLHETQNIRLFRS